jgi:parvulin-like peptidyl-prolyl isomerase
MTHGFIKSPGKAGMLPFIVMLLLIIACESKKPSPPPAIEVAKVNGEEITVAEFEKSLTQEISLAQREAPLKADEIESLKEAVLDNLIQDKLMLQRARDLSIFVSETDLSARIEEIRKDYNGQFDKLFGDEEIDFLGWKEKLRKRILIEKLIAKDVNAKIQVTDEEAEHYYNANRKAYAMDNRVRVAQIVVPDRKRAEQILKRLKAGEDFGMVAREVSIGPEAVRGGDLGFLEKGIMPEAIDRMLFSLAVGKISPVVQSPYGFHIFKVLSQAEAGGRVFANVREKVIGDLRKRREEEAYRAWIEGLKARATIRIERPLPKGVAPTGMEGNDPAQAVSGQH